jgi:simple sugar transport system permease protein
VVTTDKPAPGSAGSSSASSGAGGGPAGRGTTWRSVLGAFLRRREASVFIVAIGLMVYFRFSSDVFLDKANLVNIAQATAPGAIVAVGIVLLLVSGEIDLSVGMVFGWRRS